MRVHAWSASSWYIELSRVGATLADQVIGQPAAGDSLELTEQVQLRLLIGRAPVFLQQGLGEMVDQRGRAQIPTVDQVQVDALADDAGIVRDGRADDVRREDQGRVLAELRVDVFLRQFHAVSLHAREANLTGVPIRGDGPDRYRLARLRLPGGDRLGGEVERDAEHVGVLDVEQALLVQIVGLAAEGAAHHLLAQKLGAERAYSEDVGDGAGVPALGEHRDRHHAAGGAAEPARHADGVHHFAQQVLVGEAFGLAAVAGARDDLATEALDLVARGDPEVPAESFPGVELLAVDQQGVRSGERVAVFVEVPKQLQPSVLERRGAVLMLAMKPGDVVVEQFRSGRVVAHDDEARRRLNARFAPLVEDLLVVAIERFEGGLQPYGNAQRVEQRGLGAPLSWHLRADVLPQVPKRGHLATGDIVRHRHTRQLDDAALDRVHQREVAHRPGEQRALRVAGAAQEEWRGRKIEHPAQTQPALHHFEAGNPYPRGFAVLPGLPAVVCPSVWPRRSSARASRGSSDGLRR